MGSSGRRSGRGDFGSGVDGNRVGGDYHSLVSIMDINRKGLVQVNMFGGILERHLMALRSPFQ